MLPPSKDRHEDRVIGRMRIAAVGIVIEVGIAFSEIGMPWIATSVSPIFNPARWAGPLVVTCPTRAGRPEARGPVINKPAAALRSGVWLAIHDGIEAPTRTTKVASTITARRNAGERESGGVECWLMTRTRRGTGGSRI